MLRGRQTIEQEQSWQSERSNFLIRRRGTDLLPRKAAERMCSSMQPLVEAAGIWTLNEGQKVAFDIQPDARGAKAVNLRAA